MFTCMLFTTQIFFISKHLSSMFLFLFGRLVLVYFVMLLWPFLSLLFILCILLSFITRATLFWKDYTFLYYMGDLSCSIFLTFQLRVWSSFVWYPCIHLPVNGFFLYKEPIINKTHCKAFLSKMGTGNSVLGSSEWNINHACIWR